MVYQILKIKICFFTGVSSDFNMKLTPSKTDFCAKFGVLKDELFKQGKNNLLKN